MKIRRLRFIFFGHERMLRRLGFVSCHGDHRAHTDTSGVSTRLETSHPVMKFTGNLVEVAILGTDSKGAAILGSDSDVEGISGTGSGVAAILDTGS